MSRDVRTVLMTAPDRETGLSLARSLVQERLVACGNVIPGLRSVYWWEGEVEEADEVLVLLKTRADRVTALIERAAELHPYDVPEVLVGEVSEGFGPYLEWVIRESEGGAD